MPQGDAELKMGLTISPFMDRRKDKSDFSKGQVSFINFIVVPLFEAISELLPKLDFTRPSLEQWLCVKLVAECIPLNLKVSTLFMVFPPFTEHIADPGKVVLKLPLNLPSPDDVTRHWW